MDNKDRVAIDKWVASAEANVISDVADLTKDDVRAERNKRHDLIDIRECNADLWDGMTAAKKTAWRAYKKKLRDLPADINLTGVKNHNDMVALFPVKPS